MNYLVVPVAVAIVAAVMWVIARAHPKPKSDGLPVFLPTSKFARVFECECAVFSVDGDKATLSVMDKDGKVLATAVGEYRGKLA